MSNLDGLVVENIPLGHDDHRRTIYLAFDTKCDFLAVKEATIIIPKQATVLGEHWHNFKELFAIVKGNATFYLQDVDEPALPVRRVAIRPYQRIMIPPRVAHAFTISEDSIILAYLEKSFEPPTPFFFADLSF